MQDEFTERRQRKLNMPEDRRQQERRLEERVAVLEIRVDNFTNREIDTADKVDVLISRFDDHIEEEHARSITTNETMAKVSNTVDNLVHEIKRTNDMLVKFTEIMTDTKERVAKWETTKSTIVSIAIVISVVVGAAWAVWDYVADHTNLMHGEVTATK